MTQLRRIVPAIQYSPALTIYKMKHLRCTNLTAVLVYINTSESNTAGDLFNNVHRNDSRCIISQLLTQ